MRFNLLNVTWTPEVNHLVVRCCRCGLIFSHKCNLWTVRCTKTCGNRDHIDNVRCQPLP